MVFKITRGQGFHITFANGVTVSVQFGGGLYCSHHNDNLSLSGRGKESTNWESPDAEVAAWDREGKWITEEFFHGGDDIEGYQNPEQVLALLNWAANYGKE